MKMRIRRVGGQGTKSAAVGVVETLTCDASHATPTNPRSRSMRVEMSRHTGWSGVLGALLILLPSVASGQGVLVDEGTFDISLNGAPAGSEHFAIRRSGSDSNPQFIATAEISIAAPEGPLDLRPALQVVGPSATVSAYQVKISGARREEVYLTAGDQRFLIRTRSERGERERELRDVPGTVLLDTYVAHHYHFLVNGPFESGGRVPVIVPTEGRAYMLPLSEMGTETLSIGGRPVQLRHLQLGDGEAARQVWVDGQGRVVRVELPASGYAAVRESLPRATR